MQYKDYYQILGVARDAGAEDIRRAFRRLARKYHPDVSREPDAELRMKEINEANAVLSDPEKRAAYDRLGPGFDSGQEFRPPPGWDSGFEFSGSFSPQDEADFSDFFSRLFGHPPGTGGRGRARGVRRGADHRATVVLDIEDSFTEAVRPVSLRIPHFDDAGRLTTTERVLKVRIPRGVRAGQVIRLAGQGAPGREGGAAGDLLLEVEFRPHPRFRAEQADLHTVLPLAPWEAALGARVSVELPNGAIDVRVPAGAQGGQTLRVRGKGLPGNPPGDLLLELRIVLPPADTPKAREIYETMAKHLAFDPRRSVRA